jgi:hypothetical protein
MGGEQMLIDIKTDINAQLLREVLENQKKQEIAFRSMFLDTEEEKKNSQLCEMVIDDVLAQIRI